MIRGLPGSGKSTVAKAFKTAGAFHVETDMYWGPEYKFDASKLKEAHEWCQNSVRQLFDKNVVTVVVSNTFTTAFELLPYFDIAKEFNIYPQVILCQGQFGNIHNVPEEVIKKMEARFEYSINHLWTRLL